MYIHTYVSHTCTLSSLSVLYECMCAMYIFTKQPTITKHTALPHGQIQWNSVYG